MENFTEILSGIIGGVVAPLVWWLEKQTKFVGEIIRPNVIIAGIAIILGFGLRYFIAPEMLLDVMFKEVGLAVGIGATMYSGGKAVVSKKKGKK